MHAKKIHTGMPVALAFGSDPKVGKLNSNFSKIPPKKEPMVRSTMCHFYVGTILGSAYCFARLAAYSRLQSPVYNLLAISLMLHTFSLVIVHETVYNGQFSFDFQLFTHKLDDRLW